MSLIPKNEIPERVTTVIILDDENAEVDAILNKGKKLRGSLGGLSKEELVAKYNQPLADDEKWNILCRSRIKEGHRASFVGKRDGNRRRNGRTKKVNLSVIPNPPFVIPSELSPELVEGVEGSSSVGVLFSKIPPRASLGRNDKIGRHYLIFIK